MVRAIGQRFRELQTSRRALLTGALALAGLAAAGCRDERTEPEEEPTPKPTEEPTVEGMLTLKPSDNERKLPERFFGLQCEVMFENITDDPLMVPPAKELAPSLIRFGGMMANYYDWRTGHYSVPRTPNRSQFGRVFQSWENRSRRVHPNGMFIEAFHEFCQEVGAEIVLVPNLETSTVEEQAAWFAHMKEKGIVPRRIELGNEFWVALMGDPEVEKQFPDSPTAMRIMKESLDGFRQYLPDDALIAAQSAASRFQALQDVPGVHLLHRMWQWDDELTSEPWFQAVAVHLFPEPDYVVGPGTLAGLRNNVERAYPALMARMDAGVDRALKAIEEQLPGKEIWLTEWNPTGINHLFSGRPLDFMGLHVQMAARTILALLRRPSVGMSMYSTISYTGGAYAVFAPNPEGEGYVPIGPAGLLRWFHEAAESGATYQHVEVDGAKRIPGGGTIPSETYSDVEAALLQKSQGATLMIQNASGEAKPVRLSRVMDGRPPARAETIETPDLVESFSRSLPPVRSIEVGRDIELPAYSLTRVIWE